MHILSTINVAGIIIIIMITTIVIIVIIVALGKLGKPIETQFKVDGLQTASTFRLALACCFLFQNLEIGSDKSARFKSFQRLTLRTIRSGGFLKWGYTTMDGLYWNILFKWFPEMEGPPIAGWFISWEIPNKNG